MLCILWPILVTGAKKTINNGYIIIIEGIKDKRYLQQSEEEAWTTAKDSKVFTFLGPKYTKN